MSKRNDPFETFKSTLGRARAQQRAAAGRGEKPKPNPMREVWDADDEAHVDALMKGPKRAPR